MKKANCSQTKQNKLQSSAKNAKQSISAVGHFWPTPEKGTTFWLLNFQNKNHFS